MPDTFDRLKQALADRYVIERELGAGGMATVYLADDVRHDRKVAVKVLRPDLAQHLGADRFLREIKLAASLQHPHIVPLYDSGESDGFLWYVMPYIKGESLRSRLDREHELPVGEAIRILRGVADALAFAHAEGIVHRDIKPDNVMLSGRHAVVTDFGVAKAVSEATGREKLTTAGIALGTPMYMAPEQAVADPNVDHRADIYAFGAVAYELVTGQPPFVGSTAQMILSAHVADPPKPVSEIRTAVPPGLGNLIMRCLEKRPADRWQTADELLQQLETLTTPSGGVTPTDTRPVTAATAPVGRSVRNYGLAVAAALIAVVGWWLVRGPAGGVASIERIAVLPLENATGDAEQEFFSEGITHELISVLTSMGVRVVGARAVAPYRDTDLPPSAIARELNADALVFGRVLSATDQVRLAVELMDPETQENIWSDTYDAPAVNILSLQNQVAREIANQIQAEITPEQEARLATARQVDREAYAQYLLGAQQSLRWTEDGYRRSVGHFETAIRLDSTFAAAFASLARAREWAVWYQWITPDSGRPLIEDAVNTALSLDDQLGMAHVVRGFLEYHIDWDFDAAEESFRRGVELSPTASEFQQYALFLADMGRLDDAIATVQRAIDLEPTTAQWYNDLGWWLQAAEQYDRAIDAAQQAIELDPTFFEAHQLLAWIYTYTGRFDDAQQELALSETLYGGTDAYHQMLWASIYAGSGRQPQAVAALRRLDGLAREAAVPTFGLFAFVQMSLGNADSALTLLERAADGRDLLLPPLLTREPVFYPLRSSPRFQALRARVGLP